MKDRQWDIAVVGSINTDYTARGKDLPGPGDSLDGDEFQISQGGKGANQAVAAARLGAHVAIIGRVGQDERGESARQNFDAQSVDTENLIVDNDHATGAAVIHVSESGEKQIMAVANANKMLSPEDMHRAGIIGQARVLLCQLEVPVETIQMAAQLGAEAGVQVILDPSPPQDLPDDLLRNLTLIKPNAGEAHFLTGVEVADQDSARRAAHILMDRGISAVAIQAGSEGNLLIWEDGEVWLPKIEVDSVDATGAGDAFAAGLAVSLAQGKSWEAAGWIASAAAALTTTQLGAQSALPSREDVEDLLAGQERAPAESKGR